jgi:hypothetical protein
MSELLNIYMDNLNIIFNKINKTMKPLTSQKTEKFDISCKDLDINIKEAERMLKQMDLEIAINVKDKQDGLKIFNTYKKRLDDSKSTYFKAKEDYIYTVKMKELMVTNETDRCSTSETQPFEPKSLITTSNDNLKLAKKTCMEIEQTSKVIMKDLEKQTGDMKAIGSKVGEMNGELNSSNKLIGRMMSRENRKKTFVGVFSVTLLCLFVLISYMRF